jgi:hypothetical protein
VPELWTFGIGINCNEARSQTNAMLIVAFIFVVAGLYACVKKEVPASSKFVVLGKPARRIGVALIAGGLLAMILPQVLNVVDVVNGFVSSFIVSFATLFASLLFVRITIIVEKRRGENGSGTVGNSRQQFAKIVAWSAAIFGCILVTGTFWADVLDPLIFDAKGEYRTGGIFPILSPLLEQFNMALSFGWFKGLPFLFIGVAGLVFLYGRESVRFTVVRSRPFTSVALTVVLLAHAIIFAISAQFFFVPAGSAIRPMGWAMFVGIVSLVAFLLAEPISVVATIKERPRFLGIIGMVGGITPFFFSSFILHLAARIKGFELEP